MAKLKASIDFGLIHIPVAIVSAEDRSEQVSFHLFDSKDESRIRLKRVNETTGKEVEWGDIIKGYEVEKDNYVFFTEEELQALREESNRSLAIDTFIDPEEIDPTLFESPYYIVPEKGGERAYAILEKALSSTEKYAVVQAVLRNREQLGVIYAKEGGLVLEMLRYPEEIKKVEDVVPDVSSKVKISQREISMAERLIKQMSGKFKASQYKDHYADKLHAAIKEKTGSRRPRKTAIMAKRTKRPGKTVDIMELLASSLKEAGGSRKKRAAGSRRA